MYWEELDLKEAPEKGQLLAYTRKKVVFKEYANFNEVRAELEGEELLEIHLFDENKEYRAITTRSPRFPDKIIQTTENFADNDTDVYKENILLEKNEGIITVLNHIHYDENGLASLDNYRLKMGGQ